LLVNYPEKNISNRDENAWMINAWETYGTIRMNATEKNLRNTDQTKPFSSKSHVDIGRILRLYWLPFILYIFAEGETHATLRSGIQANDGDVICQM
jgi:hypothetical protein